MKDAMELRRQSLQNASNSQGDGSKSSLQEASGSKAPMVDTVPTLQCGAATKASGPLEAPSCSTNNTSGQRKVKRKLPPPTSSKSRPAPPPPPRAVAQCAQPATSPPPRPPPPSVKDAKISSKHNEEKASKDGGTRRSTRPQKCRNGLKTKNKYPKELNPFGSDTSLSSGKKTSRRDFPPELNPFSEEYNDEQGSSSEGDTISGHVKECDNEHSKTSFTKEEHGELQDANGEKCSKINEGDGHGIASELESNDISSDGSHFIVVDSVQSSPSGKQAPMREEERTPMNEASTSCGETSIPEDSPPSAKPAAMQKEKRTPNTTMAEVSTSCGDTAIHVEPVECPPFKKEAPVQQEESTPITTMPAASTSSGDTSTFVEPVDFFSSGKEAAEQQQGSAPNTTLPEVAASSETSSIPKVIESSLSCKEVPVQHKTLPITTVPEASTYSLACIIPVEPLESLPYSKEEPVQQEKHTTMDEASNSGEVLSFPVMPLECSLSRKESRVQQGEGTLNTTLPKAAVPSEARSIPVELVEPCPSGKEEPFHQEESAPTTATPETSTSSHIHSDSVESLNACSLDREAPRQDESTPTATKPEVSTCSETCSILVVEAFPSETKTPLHPEQRGCSTAGRVASTAPKFEFPPQLNPFSEECNDEQGSSSEGDTISNDGKECYKTEVFVLLVRNKIARVGLFYEICGGFRWTF